MPKKTPRTAFQSLRNFIVIVELNTASPILEIVSFSFAGAVDSAIRKTLSRNPRARIVSVRAQISGN